MTELLTEGGIARHLKALREWRRAGDTIWRSYHFGDFRAAMAFVNRVAGIAEAWNHHPNMLVREREVTLTLTSHDAGGLTERDFQLAQQIDA